MASLVMAAFGRFDLYGILAVFYVTIIAFTIYLIRTRQFPSIANLQDLATLFNTKGGLIILLTIMWLFTLVGTVIFAVWILVRGIDPSNSVVVAMLALLTGTAFGNVNGAWLKTMTGEEPSRNGNGKPSVPAPLTQEKPAG